MSTKIRQIPLDRLVPHPDNPNRMSQANFNKLVCNIERTGRYEPLVIRPCPGRRGFFQIINGHHRCEALRKLGHKTAEALVWRVSNEQADVLLVTLNRLNGRDVLDKKLAILRRLNESIPIHRLARLLPQTRGQLARLMETKPLAPARQPPTHAFAVPMVFFVSEAQRRMIEEALSRVSAAPPAGSTTRAARRAAALACLAEPFVAGRASQASRPR